jgi:subtilase family serine protease
MHARAALVVFLFAATARAAVPPDAVRIGRCARDMAVAPLVLTFPARDPAELAALLARQQDPRSPDYRRWLAPDEFAARFGAPEAAWAEAQRWLLTRGFTTRPGRAGSRSGSAGPRAVERAFRVPLYEYRWRGEKRVAPVGAPALPEFAGVAPRAVLGLDTFARVRPHARVNGTNFLAPVDVATVFGLGAAHAGGTTGNGVRIAILAISDFDEGLVAVFRRGFGLPAGTVEKRFASTNPGTTSDAIESLLDAQWAGAAAPGARLLVEIAAGDSSLALIEAMQDIVSHNLAPIVSVSLGVCEPLLGQEQAELFDDLDAQAAAQGQSVLVASGDAGVTDCGDGSREPAVNALASSPSVTAVGGTIVDPLFDANGNATGYGGEVVWNEAGGATGGGLSNFFARPAYQMAVSPHR